MGTLSSLLSVCKCIMETACLQVTSNTLVTEITSLEGLTAHRFTCICTSSATPDCSSYVSKPSLTAICLPGCDEHHGYCEKPGECK